MRKLPDTPREGENEHSLVAGRSTEEDPGGESSPAQTRKIGRTLLRELGLFFLFSAVLLTFEYAGDRFLGRYYVPVALGVWIAYALACFALLVAALIFNRGFNSEVPSPEDLTPSFTLEQKLAYIEKIKRNKRTAKKIIGVLLPLAGAFLLDLLSLYLF